MSTMSCSASSSGASPRSRTCSNPLAKMSRRNQQESPEEILRLESPAPRPMDNAFTAGRSLPRLVTERSNKITQGSYDGLPERRRLHEPQPPSDGTREAG